MSFDISKDPEGFICRIQESVLGREIVGMRVESGEFELHLSDGGAISFRIEDGEIVMRFPLDNQEPGDWESLPCGTTLIQ